MNLCKLDVDKKLFFSLFVFFTNKGKFADKKSKNLNIANICSLLNK